MRLLNIPGEKIDVVYHASSLDPKNIQPVKISKNYILFVGGRASYKNFSPFITAIAPLLKKYDLAVFCAGGDAFRTHELELFKSLSVEDRFTQKDVSDPELAFLYAHALCFAYPSRYEGFGIPILEAYSCNCPVALSNVSCFPEVAQDAGIYFDPLESDSMKNVIESLITSEELRKELVQKGQKRLEHFSWHKTAQDTLKTYNTCIHAKN
jgi:glycosyltransferase involved in cell wall biosynthesis